MHTRTRVYVCVSDTCICTCARMYVVGNMCVYGRCAVRGLIHVFMRACGCGERMCMQVRLHACMQACKCIRIHGNVFGRAGALPSVRMSQHACCATESVSAQQRARQHAYVGLLVLAVLHRRLHLRWGCDIAY